MKTFKTKRIDLRHQRPLLCLICFLSLLLLVPSAKKALRKEPPPLLFLEEMASVETSPLIREVKGVIPSGSSLYDILVENGVSPSSVVELSRAFRGKINFRRLRPGEKYRFLVSQEGRLVEFEYHRSPEEVYLARKDGKRWKVETVPVELEKLTVMVKGEIESSLYESVIKLGESPELAYLFADIFAWDIDFRTYPRKGDKFKILVDKYYLDGRFLRYGTIKGAQYQRGNQIHTAILYEDPQGNCDYYTPEGRSLRRAFLKSPLKYTRISSGYSLRRFHPILHIWRPHRGIDYAAPYGTPVWAVADGVVIYRGWLGQAGRVVRIRHPNGYISSYGHLSRWARGIRKGVKVKQKQVIGYVGTSGLATGPHLDFRMKKNGRFVNPLRLPSPRGKRLPAKLMPEFERVKAQVLAKLNGEDGEFASLSLRDKEGSP